MAFDFKKEFKEYYLPPCKPEIVNVPPANFIAVRGSGNPNDLSTTRHHHEIYLSDPRKKPPEKLKTVVRHPVKKG